MRRSATLFARDPAEQRTTPLQIVRGLVAAPTAVLAAAGVPGVVRDAFEERAFPDDEYDLVPRTLGDLGDPDLGPLLLAWGIAKAAVLRAALEPGTFPDRPSVGLNVVERRRKRQRTVLPILVVDGPLMRGASARRCDCEAHTDPGEALVQYHATRS